MHFKRLLSTCLRLACVLFLVVDTVGIGLLPDPVPIQTAYARMPDPVLPVRAVGDSVTAASGSPQSTQVNTAFSAPFTVLVLDFYGQPAPDEAVTFQAPSGLSAPSGTFPGGLDIVFAVTGLDGMATSPIFTANGIAGTYQVRASVPGGLTEATFDLTNQAAPTATSTATATPTSTATATATATVTGTATATPTGTLPTATPTGTATATLAATSTATSTLTATPTGTRAATSTGTVTATPTSTSTVTPVVPPPTTPGTTGQSAVTSSGGEGSPPLVIIQRSAGGSAILQFYAYPIVFLGGVHLAMADVNGDGVPEIITAPGNGMQALIRVWDGRDAHLILEFLAFPSSFVGGAWVAAGDVDGDGKVEIVVGVGPGGGTVVRIFNGQTGAFIREISDFSGPLDQDEDEVGSAAVPPLLVGALSVRAASATGGGVHVAVADMDGDGMAEIVADFVGSTSGISAAADNPLLMLALLGGNYGSNNRRCGRNNSNDALMPLLMLTGTDLGASASGVYSGSNFEDAILPLLFLSGGNGLFGGNNNRRCRRRRRMQRFGNGTYAGGYGGFAETNQNFGRVAIGTDASGNEVVYGGASGAGPGSYVSYETGQGSSSGSSIGSAGAIIRQDVGAGGVYIAAVAPRAVTATSAQVNSRNEEDSPRKLTATERRQKERTNRLGLDDDHTEGNVLSVGQDDRGPFAIIANRDGQVTVLLQCDDGCPKIEAGQYLEAGGVKEHEQLFTAYDVNVTAVR